MGDPSNTANKHVSSFTMSLRLLLLCSRAIPRKSGRSSCLGANYISCKGPPVGPLSMEEGLLTGSTRWLLLCLTSINSQPGYTWLSREDFGCPPTLTLPRSCGYFTLPPYGTCYGSCTSTTDKFNYSGTSAYRRIYQSLSTQVTSYHQHFIVWDTTRF